MTFHFNHNVHITLIVSYDALPSDKEKRLMFVLLMFREQILCHQLILECCQEKSMN